MSCQNPAQRIVARAHQIGFQLAGVAAALPPPDTSAYRRWVAQGYHGEMGYLARPDRVARRLAPETILAGVASVVVVALNYAQPAPPDAVWRDPRRGWISRYAWGMDYHDLMLPRIEALGQELTEETGCAWRAYVDTGPVLERAYAARAGLGFIGNNGCLIHPRRGSWFFLGVLLTTARLEPSAKDPTGGCGTCRRCIEACPTGALVAPGVLDARRCISYLTIELKDAIPQELREGMGRWVFGCDACQTVCPWQRFAEPSREAALRPPHTFRQAPQLGELIRMDEQRFHKRYAGTPLERTGATRLARNAAVALGNAGGRDATIALDAGLAHRESLVRAHAAWALGQIGTLTAARRLTAALDRERDPRVREEIRHALRMWPAK
jgi:epoxyqueuosine reductase